MSSDLTADIVCRILHEEITDDRVQSLKAVGELFIYNFQIEMLRTTPLSSKLSTITRLCFGSCSIFATVFSKVVLHKGIEKYDRRIGVCIKSCREDAYILKRMQMDCIIFGDFPRTFCCLSSQSLQADRLEHEVGHSAS